MKTATAAAAPAALEPPDLARCQSDITPAHGPFVLGPRPRPRRCENPAAFLATETRPGADGQVGSMTLCASCLLVFQKQTPPGFATLRAIVNGRLKKESPHA